jgi:hypothetical protein
MLHPDKKFNQRLVLCNILVLFGLMIFYQVKQPEASPPAIIAKPDTVYSDKPIIPVAVASKAIPAKVAIHKADTVARQQLEKQTIVTGIRKARDKLEVQKMDPLGIAVQEDYPLPEPELIKEIRIDTSGNVEVISEDPKKANRRKRFKKIGNTVLVAVAFVVGVLIAK